MRRALLSTSLALALGLVMLQLPKSVYVAMSDAVLSVAAVGGLTSQADYGTMLGEQVHAVVNNIHARIPDAQITHADILTVMCMESAGLIGNREIITSSAGARGMTQVMPATLAEYARTRKGGFYLDNRPDLLYSNSRFSIEAGALIFNHHLMNYVPKYGEMNGRTIAAIAYNGGPGRVGLPRERLPRETRDYAYTKLPNCYNQIKRGVSPVNNTVWKAMVARVWQLTNGKMSLDGAPGIPSEITAQTTAPTSGRNQIQRLAQQWWGSPQGQTILQQQPQQLPLRQPVAPVYTPPPPAPQSPAPQQRSWIERIWERDNKSRVAMEDKPTSSLECESTPRGVKIKWSCPGTSTITKGYAPQGQRFNTHGANTGAIHAIDAPDGEYKIVCIQGHRVLSEARCVATTNNVTADDSWDIISGD